MTGPVRVTRAMLILACACGGTGTPSEPRPMSNESASTELPTVRRQADVKPNADRRVRVVGVYEQIDVRKRDPRVGEKVFRGHAGLRLEDGGLVTLDPPSEPSAVRPAAEIAANEGKLVIATGKLYPLGASSEPHVARMITPCIWPVESIEPAPAP
jgi:hypothetical protein